jgi:hypothetical protein
MGWAALFCVVDMLMAVDPVQRILDRVNIGPVFFTAILIMTFTAFKSPVILAGMPVSSHRDVKPQGDGNAKSSTYALSKLPSMALDFGIPAKMTAHIAIMRIAVFFMDGFAHIKEYGLKTRYRYARQKARFFGQ